MYFTDENASAKCAKYLSDISTPPEILNILNGETILSGGMIIRGLTDSYEPIRQFDPYDADLINVMKIVTTMLGEDYVSAVSGDSDYDIYTSREYDDIFDHFDAHGYNIKQYNFDENGESVITLTSDIAVFDASYTKNVMRLRKVYDDDTYIDVDIIHHNRPKQFIDEEFDFNVCKIWFNGQIVQSPIENIFSMISNRTFKLSFHDRMTINKYKTFTTMRRIFKYTNRGFKLITEDQDDMDTFHNFILRWYSSNALRLLKYFNRDMIVHYFDSLLTRNIDSIKETDDQNKQIYSSHINSGRIDPDDYYPVVYENTPYTILLEKFYIACIALDLPYLRKILMRDDCLSAVEYRNGYLLRYLAKYNRIEHIIPMLSKMESKHIKLSPYDFGYTVINLALYASPASMQANGGGMLTLYILMGYITANGYDMEYYIKFFKHMCVNKEFVSRLHDEEQMTKVKTVLRAVLNEMFKDIPDYEDIVGTYLQSYVKFVEPEPANRNEILNRFVIKSAFNRDIRFNDAGSDADSDADSDTDIDDVSSIMEDTMDHDTVDDASLFQVQQNLNDALQQLQPQQHQSHHQMPQNLPISQINIKHMCRYAIDCNYQINYSGLYDQDVSIFNEAYENNVRLGDMYIIYTIAMHGDMVDDASKLFFMHNCIRLAQKLSIRRGSKCIENECSNYNQDSYTLESYKDISKSKYFYICFSYGIDSVTYCVRYDTIEDIYYQVRTGDNLIVSCNRNPGYFVNKSIEIQHHNAYVKLPLSINYYIDLYSFILMAALVRQFGRTPAQLVFYFEMVSSDVLLYNRFGVSEIHGEVGDERDVYSLGKACFVKNQNELEVIPINPIVLKYLLSDNTNTERVLLSQLKSIIASSVRKINYAAVSKNYVIHDLGDNVDFTLVTDPATSSHIPMNSITRKNVKLDIASAPSHCTLISENKPYGEIIAVSIYHLNVGRSYRIGSNIDPREATKLMAMYPPDIRFGIKIDSVIKTIDRPLEDILTQWWNTAKWNHIIIGNIIIKRIFDNNIIIGKITDQYTNISDGASSLSINNKDIQILDDHDLNELRYTEMNGMAYVPCQHKNIDIVAYSGYDMFVMNNNTEWSVGIINTKLETMSSILFNNKILHVFVNLDDDFVARFHNSKSCMFLYIRPYAIIDEIGTLLYLEKNKKLIFAMYNHRLVLVGRLKDIVFNNTTDIVPLDGMTLLSFNNTAYLRFPYKPLSPKLTYSFMHKRLTMLGDYEISPILINPAFDIEVINVSNIAYNDSGAYYVITSPDSRIVLYLKENHTDYVCVGKLKDNVSNLTSYNDTSFIDDLSYDDIDAIVYNDIDFNYEPINKLLLAPADVNVPVRKYPDSCGLPQNLIGTSHPSDSINIEFCYKLEWGDNSFLIPHDTRLVFYADMNIVVGKITQNVTNLAEVTISSIESLTLRDISEIRTKIDDMVYTYI